MSEIEDICREAITNLRANKGCDITFKSLSDSNTPWNDPLTIYVLFLNLLVHGKHLELAIQSEVFSNDVPTNIDEEKVLLGTKSKQKMLVIRTAKIIYENYKGWLKNNGLANKIVDAPLTSSIDNVPVYTSTGPSVSRLHIGSKVVDLSDSYARTAISNVTDSVTDLKDALDQEKQRNQTLQDRLDLMEAILKSKGLLDY